MAGNGQRSGSADVAPGAPAGCLPCRRRLRRGHRWCTASGDRGCRSDVLPAYPPSVRRSESRRAGRRGLRRVNGDESAFSAHRLRAYGLRVARMGALPCLISPVTVMEPSMRPRRVLSSLLALLLGVCGIGLFTGAGTAYAAVGCSVDYAKNDWGSGFSVTITLHNLGDPLSGWTLTYAYAGDQKLSQGWSGTWSQSGKNITVTNASWNGALAGAPPPRSARTSPTAARTPTPRPSRSTGRRARAPEAEAAGEAGVGRPARRPRCTCPATSWSPRAAPPYGSGARTAPAASSRASRATASGTARWTRPRSTR